jgi:hypothetical protein
MDDDSSGATIFVGHLDYGLAGVVLGAEEWPLLPPARAGERAEAERTERRADYLA